MGSSATLTYVQQAGTALCPVSQLPFPIRVTFYLNIFWKCFYYGKFQAVTEEQCSEQTPNVCTVSPPRLHLPSLYLVLCLPHEHCPIPPTKHSASHQSTSASFSFSLSKREANLFLKNVVLRSLQSRSFGLFLMCSEVGSRASHLQLQPSGSWSRRIATRLKPA